MYVILLFIFTSDSSCTESNEWEELWRSCEAERKVRIWKIIRLSHLSKSWNRTDLRNVSILMFFIAIQESKHSILSLVNTRLFQTFNSAVIHIMSIKFFSWSKNHIFFPIRTCVTLTYQYKMVELSLIHIWRCRRYAVCRSRWSPYH